MLEAACAHFTGLFVGMGGVFVVEGSFVAPSNSNIMCYDGGASRQTALRRDFEIERNSSWAPEPSSSWALEGHLSWALEQLLSWTAEPLLSWASLALSS